MREIQARPDTQIQDAVFNPVVELKLPVTDAMRREVLNSCTKKELEDEMSGRGYRLETWPDMIRALTLAFLFLGLPLLIAFSQRCESSRDGICRLFGW